MTSPEVEAAIGGFRSRSVPEAAADFAREVVAAARPPSAARARALLFAVSKLAAFGLGRGLELSPEVLLHPSVVERFCTKGLSAVSGATLRTLRTNLRYVASRVTPGSPRPAPLARERAKAPYSASEIAAYLALADTQPNPARRARLGALLCLGAGAGLMGAELRSVRGADVLWRSGGLLVVVGGRRPRAVPVRGEFHERLVASAGFAGEGYVIGGADATRRNVTYPLVSSLAGGRDLPALDTGRLRSTWLARCGEDLGLKAFFDAAGIVCSQRLGDVVGALEPPEERRAVELLGGRH